MERGSVVVCLTNDWVVHELNNKIIGGLPKKDKEYTVREIYSDPDGVFIGIRLEEITCGNNPYTGLEYGWDIRAFREVLSRTEYNQEEINNLLKQPQYI